MSITYFNVNQDGRGELWVTDGTQTGSHLVQSFSSYTITEMKTIGRRAYFTINDGVDGDELWTSDGTTAGTMLVKDINPGAASSTYDSVSQIDYHQHYPSDYNGTLIFEATDGIHGLEPWRSNGTAAGTSMIDDLNPGSSNSYPFDFTNYKGLSLFYSLDQTYGDHLWKTDGTQSGTSAIVVNDTLFGISDITVFKGEAFFSAQQDSMDGLWKTDGTSAGTSFITNMTIDRIVPASDKMYIVSGYGKLLATDGTSAGTVQLDSSDPNEQIGNYTVFGGLLFYEDHIGGSDQLWVSDGTIAGTRFIKTIGVGADSPITNYLKAFGDDVYFSATDAAHGTELWKTDGTTAGTMLVTDVNAGSGGSDPSDLLLLNGKLEFTAFDGTSTGLFITDGTAAGTTEIAVNVGQYPAQAVTKAVSDDFSNSGTSGVLLQSGASVIDWSVKNGTYQGYQQLASTNGYTAVGTGDFNGDGTTDVLLKDGGGDVADVGLQNGQTQYGYHVGNAQGYNIVGTGDFNHDGTSDVLLENGSGTVIDWLMQNGTYQGYSNVGNAAGYGIVGTGDYDGDGTADALLEDGAGDVIDWIMGKGTLQSYNYVGNVQGYGVVGQGDYNGDGNTDILLENGQGDVIDWLMQGGQYFGYQEVGNVAGYGIVATGDYNGDGTTDVLLENANHDVIEWTMKNEPTPGTRMSGTREATRSRVPDARSRSDWSSRQGAEIHFTEAGKHHTLRAQNSPLGGGEPLPYRFA